jgi:hypothetical protein
LPSRDVAKAAILAKAGTAILFGVQRLSKIKIPAIIARTARPVVMVEESLIFSRGRSPVRISQRPNKSIPRFLPANVFVNAISSPFPNYLKSLIKTTSLVMRPRAITIDL